MTGNWSRTGAVAITAILIVSLVAPAAAGAAAVADQATVTTDEPTDVTDSSATLQGNLTALGNATEAVVSFEYWEEGDEANSSIATSETVNETGAFEASVEDLSANTTYAVEARANASGSIVTGETVTFTTDEPPVVRTNEATDVTDSSATLNGELVDLDGAENATVWFEYWQVGANASTTDGQTVNETEAFEATVDDLEANETYAYVAYAELDDGETKSGAEVRFDTHGDDWEDGELTFGERVSAYVHSLLEGSIDGPLGQQISEWVTANNPANDNKPDHAGPDNDRGASSAESDNGDDDSGPPAHANNGGNGGDQNAESSDDDDRGPPAHANNDKDDEEDEDE